MTLQTIFEQNKEHLLSAVSGRDAVSAARVLNSELDRILYTFNDQEENDRVREAAGAMIQVAKAACSLVDSDGETKVYGRTDYSIGESGRKKLSKGFIVLLILGLIGAAATVIGVQMLATSAAAGSADWQSSGLPPRYILAAVPLVTILLFFFAGMTLRRKEKSKETLHAETTMDTTKVYNHLLSVILVIDKSLEDVRNAARQEEKDRLKERSSGVDPAELDLLAQLLEDAYGRRDKDEQADEEISQIRFYLHKKNIDVVDWSADAGKPEADGGAAPGSGWFDMIPAYAAGTIRPAIAADGKLLKKGMASAGKG